ncbi:MAG: hypothetical protein MJ175_11465, partial [Clostridia bacterium]|nr:hypothetical protein [Clostridia bacterium]
MQSKMPVYTPAAEAALSEAVRYAASLGSRYLGTEHLFYALLTTESSPGAVYPCTAAVLLSSRGVTAMKTDALIRGQMPRHKDTQDPKNVGAPVPTPAYTRVCSRAE